MRRHVLHTGTKEWLYGIAAIWAVAVVALTFLVPISRDHSGRETQDHTGPVPAGVIQVKPDTYLTTSGNVLPTTICRGTEHDGNNDPYGDVGAVYTSAPVPKLNASFVVCDRAQTWNDHRPLSPNYWTAMGWTWTQTWFQGLVAGLAALMLGLWMLTGGIPDVLSYRRERRQFQALETQKALDRKKAKEADLEALSRLWAKDEITDAEYETKLAKLLVKHDA